ncbi:ABC transporter substrate-binding protein [Pseudomonas lopnurensis]|uniref:ABC transporter substrate-binding protein n=1 Tax=Pseudomonas lopnurensis TaxID=1477517 RepID=UPI001879D6A4|nr:ABC transporter substrate-binding protein [Pseudomonas lopnurensis]MBE7373778.1 ABC transporter substrate-binding protein [Pseudomonas lopnurensis]
MRKTTIKPLIATLAMIAAGSASAEISDKEIRIGYLADMSGAYRDLGGPGGLEALNMAIEDFGGQIDGAKIVVVSADDRNSPDVGANTTREWIDRRNVDMVAGLVSSAVTIAVTRILEENDKLGLVSISASSAITNEYCTPNHIHWVYDTYAMSNGTAKAIVREGGETWFILAADYAFGHAMEADVERTVKAEGGKVVGKARHPLASSDFSSYILQAQASGAQVIGLANAASDTVNAITTAKQFGLVDSGQSLAGLMVFINDVHALGLEATQGLQLTTGWYWDQNEESRAWAQRFHERTKRMPTMVQAGIYSSTRHYLQAVKDVGSDDAQAVRKQMMATPVNDMFTKNGRIREDGRMVYDMYLAQVKTPAESTGEWDLYKIARTIPAQLAFRPLSESKCKLVNKS